MKGPTMRRRIEGSARRTVKPPRSRVRGRITVSTGEAASRSANGSSGIVQLIETSLRTDAGEAAALPLTVTSRDESQGGRRPRRGRVCVLGVYGYTEPRAAAKDCAAHPARVRLRDR